MRQVIRSCACKINNRHSTAWPGQLFSFSSSHKQSRLTLASQQNHLSTSGAVERLSVKPTWTTDLGHHSTAHCVVHQVVLVCNLARMSAQMTLTRFDRCNYLREDFSNHLCLVLHPDCLETEVRLLPCARSHWLHLASLHLTFLLLAAELSQVSSHCTC